jgi:cytochrome c-type biogenesis protein CcmH/NrfF
VSTIRIAEEVAAGRMTAEHGARILNQPAARKELRAQLWLAPAFAAASGSFMTIGANEIDRGEWVGAVTILAGLAMAVSATWRISNAIWKLNLSGDAPTHEEQSDD